MSTVIVLVLFWTRLGVASQVWHGQQPAGTEHRFTTADSVSTVRHRTTCFVDDFAAALQEASENDGTLKNSSLSLFGSSYHSAGSALSELTEEIRNKREGLKVLHPVAEPVSEEDEQGTIAVTFDVPQSPLLRLKPVLLFVLESPFPGRDLDITFTSHSLQPHTQSASISESTRYILLTGKPSESTAEQKWRISVDANTPDMKQNMRDSLIGGKSGSTSRMTLLLLFLGETGSETRHAATQTSFLCALRRFLDCVLPQELTGSPSVHLDSLQSLPPLRLGLSSSETLLVGLINSSTPTIFSFNNWASKFPARQEQLALSPTLLQELGQRLEQSEMQILELIRDGKVADSGTERLRKLKDLCGFQRNEPATGEKQYCAFLLLKALQMVGHTYDVQSRLRATRAGPRNPSGPVVCGLKSLTVSFDKLFLGPTNANINNCHGLCTFPLINGNNHAVLLNSHTEDSGTDERAPCCVPVAYDPLVVVDLNNEGSFLSIKPDMIVKECGCR
ncbi:muellerian-inhibiting factor-like [Cololabis saira]|uniref:muellerian-inhibiting factor-like n=1 Tax=Cololabis saira TaxID=129043 RepID=UPI002AD4E179|nr:muellerian-inhibiting factor-like [Cololabis saira]